MTRQLRSCVGTALLLLAAAWGENALGQCLLANPSFEITGSSGAVFGGWNQFGVVGSSPVAIHGTRAALVSGPATGTWDVSGYWQALDTSPGEAWAVSVWVSHPSSRPLSGQSRAIVNIEWRDAAGGLISYESHPAADASTPSDQFLPFSVQSQPAPAGTATTRLLLGVLQGPGDPTPDVRYDHATFYALRTPTLEERQWLDFPGGRTIAFAGRTWRVKGPGVYDPGSSFFSDATNSVWVDPDGRLHLAIRWTAGVWSSAEVVLEEPLGYGDYVFTTRGRLDLLDPHAVLGMFLWEYGPCWHPSFLWWNPFNEIDIEFSRWGVPGNAVAQFVAQPFDGSGNLTRFDVTFGDDEITSHAFRWLPGRVEYRSWRGGPGQESAATLIHAWTYAGPHLPRPDQPRVHVNLWQFEEPPAVEQEVVLDAFTFVPACPSPPCIVTAVAANAAPRPSVQAPRPNPFDARTMIRYATARESRMEIRVFDVAGRLVRTLHDGSVRAGTHEVAWDGRDESGARVAAGVYFFRLQSDGFVDSRRMILLR